MAAAGFCPAGALRRGLRGCSPFPVPRRKGALRIPDLRPEPLLPSHLPFRGSKAREDRRLFYGE